MLRNHALEETTARSLSGSDSAVAGMGCPLDFAQRQLFLHHPQHILSLSENTQVHPRHRAGRDEGRRRVLVNLYSMLRNHALEETTARSLSGSDSAVAGMGCPFDFAQRQLFLHHPQHILSLHK